MPLIPLPLSFISQALSLFFFLLYYLIAVTKNGSKSLLFTILPMKLGMLLDLPESLPNTQPLLSIYLLP
uniref:Uncharacterized protein n=1 Tax=Octopus bimaculoides TaxID=37653 RepID=A0A0L8HVM3_OCTBM